jgi:tyrosyl-DNA phosphodiesterase-1
LDYFNYAHHFKTEIYLYICIYIIVNLRPLDASTISGIALQMSSISSLGVKDKFYEELISVFQTNPSKTISAGEIKTHLIWPTLKAVRNSNKGYISGGSIPAKYKELYIDETSPELKPVIKETLYKWDGSVSGRERIMPHMKCYFAYSLTNANALKRKLTTCKNKRLVIKNQLKYNKSSEEMNINLSWFLLTSANLSMAAWGTKQSKMEKLYIKSYELGVLFLPEKVFTNKRSFSCTPDHPILGVDIKESEAESESEFEAVEFPLPFKFPPIPYDLKSDDRPWIWDRDYPQFPDRFGRTSCF